MGSALPGLGGRSGGGGTGAPRGGRIDPRRRAGPGQGRGRGRNDILDRIANLGKSNGGGAIPPPPIEKNTTNDNPDIRYGTDRLRELDKIFAEGDQRSVDRLGRSLADFGQGQKRRMQASRVARGVSGTGVDNLQDAAVESDIGRQFASGAADIQLGVRDRQQGILRDIIGAGATQAGISQGDKRLALDQYNANMRRYESIQAAQERARDRELQIALQALNFLPGI